MSHPVAVALQGASGRMGRAVSELLASAEDLVLAYRADRTLEVDAGPPRSAPDLSGLSPGDVEAIVDFSSPDGTREAAEAAGRLGCVLVSGTTGIDEAAREAIRAASRSVPVCWAPNFSIGVPILTRGLREAARHLPGSWHLEIVDIHHSGKRDAPSGTALRLGEVWRDVRGGRFVHGRQGTPGPRAPEEIGLHALRVGDIVGEHRIVMGGAGETIEAVHRVQDRRAFAAGSIEALRSLLRQGPGRYEWEDLLCGR